MRPLFKQDAVALEEIDEDVRIALVDADRTSKLSKNREVLTTYTNVDLINQHNF